MSGRPLVVVGIATVPERQASLIRTIESLVGQVDHIHVWMNGHSDFSEQHRHKYARPRSHVETGTLIYHHGTIRGEEILGDAGKTVTLRQTLVPAYHFWCDDDLVYPPDYVETLIEGIERFDRRAVVGLHGARVVEPVTSYYRSRKLYHWRSRVERDALVHVLGTGCCAFWSSTIDLTMAAFEEPNMADVWLARAACRQRVPLIVLRHEPSPLTYLTPPVGTTIYERFRDHDARQTELIREFCPWPNLDLPTVEVS